MTTVDVVMPQLGYSILEGKILRWHKKVGDAVQRDETIFEITTDKIDSEIPSPAAGTLIKIMAGVGDTVKVGAVVAQIESAGAVASVSAQMSAAVATAIAPATSPAGVPAPRPSGSREYSPAVLTYAKEHGVSPDALDTLQGTGADGRVTKQDVSAYLQSKGGHQPSPSSVSNGEEVIVMDHIKKSMAEHMVKSIQTSPHAISISEVDMSKVVAFREQSKQPFEQRHGVKLTFTHLIAYGMVKAIREIPLINSSVDGDRIIVKKYVNLGVAVATERGLIVPVVKHAHQLSFPDFVKAIHDLSERARTKKLVPDDVMGGTITLTNNGTFGNMLALPIINQPQVAILAFCAIEKRAVVVGAPLAELEGRGSAGGAADRIEARPVMYLSLAYDHRVIDGATGGGFVQKVADLLESFQPPEW